MNRLLSEFNLCDEFIIQNADVINWKDVFLYHGISPVLNERFECEMNRYVNSKLIPEGFSQGFHDNYKILINNIKDMFNRVVVTYSKATITVGDFRESAFIKISCDINHVKNFRLNLNLSIDKNESVKLTLGYEDYKSRQGYAYRSNYYYESNSISFDHKLYHFLKYFKEMSPGSDYKSISHVQEKVQNSIDDWAREKLLEEHRLKNMIEDMKIKGFNL